MTAISMRAAHVIATTFPWDRYQTVIDVGCAEGCVPAQIALAHEHISGGEVDLPPVEPLFDAYVAQAGLGERLRFHAGGFFADPLPDRGALIVYDAIIDDERREHSFGLLVSLNMLIESPGGFDYTVADCQGWLRGAGFAETYTQRLADRILRSSVSRDRGHDPRACGVRGGLRDGAHGLDRAPPRHAAGHDAHPLVSRDGTARSPRRVLELKPRRKPSRRERSR
jgi:hypothetical protein